MSNLELKKSDKKEDSAVDGKVNNSNVLSSKKLVPLSQNA